MLLLVLNNALSLYALLSLWIVSSYFCGQLVFCPRRPQLKEREASAIFKYHHFAAKCFDKTKERFGEILKVIEHSLFAKKLVEPVLVHFAIGQIPIDGNGLILKNNLAIWSHCLSALLVRPLRK